VAASGNRFTTARLQPPLFLLLRTTCRLLAAAALRSCAMPQRPSFLSSFFQEKNMDPDPERVRRFADVNIAFTFTLFRSRTGGMPASLN